MTEVRVLVQFHVSGPEMVFWRNLWMILHHFCRRSSKITLFWQKTLIFYQKSFQNPKKYGKFLGFLGILVETPVQTPCESKGSMWCRLCALQHEWSPSHESAGPPHKVLRCYRVGRRSWTSKCYFYLFSRIC